jgi:hypothetical protein
MKKRKLMTREYELDWDEMVAALVDATYGEDQGMKHKDLNGGTGVGMDVSFLYGNGEDADPTGAVVRVSFEEKP